MAAATLFSAVKPDHTNLRLLVAALEQGASPNEWSEDGYTCMHLLAGSDHPDADRCLDILLDYGAHCNVKTTDGGMTPLHIAASWGKDEVIRKLLAAGADISAVNHDGETPDDLATAEHNVVCSDLLQTCTDSLGLTVLAQPHCISSQQQQHDPRVFESTVVYDLSHSDVCEDSDDEYDDVLHRTNHLRINNTAAATAPTATPSPSAVGSSPWDQAHCYNSDDSLLDTTQSDCTPVAAARCNDVLSAVEDRQQCSDADASDSTASFSSNNTLYLQAQQVLSQQSDDSYAPGTLGHHQGTAVDNNGDCPPDSLQNDIVSTGNPGNASAVFGGMGVQSRCQFASPCLADHHDNRTTACATAESTSRPTAAGVLREREQTENPCERGPPALPVFPGRSGLVNGRVRDTTFRLSIGSPVIPSQDGFDTDDSRSRIMSSVSDTDRATSPASGRKTTRTDGCGAAAAGGGGGGGGRGVGNSADEKQLHIIQARQPWHAVTENSVASLDSERTPEFDVDPDLTVSYCVDDVIGGGDGMAGKATGTGDGQAEDASFTSAGVNTSLSITVSDDIHKLSNGSLRRHLLEHGEAVGPVTDATRHVYARHLARLRVRVQQDDAADGKRTPSSRNHAAVAESVYSRELNRCLSGHTCIPQLVDMESDLCPTRHSRQYSPVARTTPKKHNDQDYVSKAFFIYFLLDPRLSCNLPLRSAADSLSEVESLQQFLKSVFYIGKGKRSRPFAHLHDAAKYSSSSSNNHANHHNGRRQGENGARNAGAGHHPKLDKINEIWTSGLGVVQFSCFQGCTTEEAHNREACCLDAVGLVNLTNKVSGTYYGEFASKSGMERRKMGIHLLAKACRIFLQEGERQYRSNAPVT